MALDGGQELILMEQDIGSVTVIDREPDSNDTGVDGGEPRDRALTGRLYRLANLRRAMVDLQRQFDRPRFRKITGLTDEAFTGLFEAWKPPVPERPNPAALEALALLKLRLE